MKQVINNFKAEAGKIFLPRVTFGKYSKIGILVGIEKILAQNKNCQTFRSPSLNQNGFFFDCITQSETK